MSSRSTSPNPPASAKDEPVAVGSSGGGRKDAAEESNLLPPVASVLRDHLLSQISGEGDKIRDANEKMAAASASLEAISIDFGGGNDIHAYLDEGFFPLLASDIAVLVGDGIGVDGDALIPEMAAIIQAGEIKDARRFDVPFYMIPSDHSLDKMMCIILPESEPVPLSDLKNVTATLANQKVGDYRNALQVHVEEGDADRIVVRVLLASGVVAIRGFVSGLNDDDVQLFRDGEYGEEQLYQYLQTGTGLQTDHAMFAPFSLDMFITPGIAKLLDLMRLGSPGHRSSSLSMAKETEYERLRLQIIEAISGDESEVEVVEEKKVLQLTNIYLKSMWDLLGTIEIHSSTGTLTLHLGKGEACLNTAMDRWIIHCERGDCVIRAGDLRHHHATLSGAPIWHYGHRFTTDQGNYTTDIGTDGIVEICLLYTNGILFIGDWDPPVLEDTPVNFNRIEVPLDLVRDTFDMIGIDYST